MGNKTTAQRKPQPFPWSMWLFILALVIIIPSILLGSCLAPCSWLGWMPAAEAPARCFQGFHP